MTALDSFAFEFRLTDRIARVTAAVNKIATIAVLAPTNSTSVIQMGMRQDLLRK
jgi:hypothetical protein